MRRLVNAMTGRDDWIRRPNATTECECDDLLLRRRLVYVMTGRDDRIRQPNATTECENATTECDALLML